MSVCYSHTSQRLTHPRYVSGLGIRHQRYELWQGRYGSSLMKIFGTVRWLVRFERYPCISEPSSRRSSLVEDAFHKLAFRIMQIQHSIRAAHARASLTPELGRVRLETLSRTGPWRFCRKDSTTLRRSRRYSLRWFAVPSQLSDEFFASS